MLEEVLLIMHAGHPMRKQARTIRYVAYCSLESLCAFRACLLDCVLGWRMVYFAASERVLPAAHIRWCALAIGNSSARLPRA